jgi:hypothetical protein
MQLPIASNSLSKNIKKSESGYFYIYSSEIIESSDGKGFAN